MVSAVNWTPAVMPLVNTAGPLESLEFVVERTGSYGLTVTIDPPPDGTRNTNAECLLGFDWDECAPVTPAIDLRWRLVSHDARPIRCGRDAADEGTVSGRGLSGRFTASETTRWLACFDLQGGSRYRLQVNAVSDPSALEPYHPRLVVQPSSAFFRNEHGKTAGVWLSSLLLGLFGAALILSTTATG